MGDVEKKLELLQKQISVLSAAVITQAKNINTIIEILERLEEHCFPGIEIPEKLTYSDLNMNKYKQ